MTSKLNTVLRSALITCFCTLLVFGSVTYTSCTKKDECKGNACKNGGSCYNGSCYCATGYSGPHCDTSDVLRFIGTWQGKNCDSVPTTLIIMRGKDSGTVTMEAKLGGGPCERTILIVGNVQDTSMTLSTQYYSDSCIGSYRYHGIAAWRRDSTMAMSIFFYDMVAGTSKTSCFVGHK